MDEELKKLEELNRELYAIALGLKNAIYERKGIASLTYQEEALIMRLNNVKAKTDLHELLGRRA